jgi:hypothetical protein
VNKSAARDLEVLSTRRLSRFVRVAGLLRRLRNARFLRARRDRVLSRQQRRCNKANQYHPTQQSPHENDWFPGNENPHSRTSGDEERRTTFIIIILRKTHWYAHSATRDCRDRSLVENSLACARISSKYFGSTTLSYSREVSSAGSRSPANIDRSTLLAQRVDASLPMK